MGRFKRQIISFLLVVLLIFVSVYLWNYLRYGTIVITSGNQNNIISVSQIDEDESDGDNVVATAAGELSVRVSPGEYSINVQGKVLATSKVVSVNARETREYKLNPPEVSPVEPVAGVEGSSLYASRSVLLYIDSAVGFFSKIEDNYISQINNNISLQKIKWSGKGTGIAQDSDKQLYTASSNALKKIALPESPGVKGVEFDVSRNGLVFTAVGPSVFSASSSGSFTKIYSAPVDAPRLAASNDKFAVINPRQADDIVGQETKAEEPFVAVVTKEGKELAKKNISGSEGFWSPDGERLFISDYSGRGVIYDKSLNNPLSMPNEDMSSVFWVDNTTIVYSVDNAVWLYSLEDKQAQVIASVELGKTIHSLYADKSSGYVYFATASEGDGGLYRVGLNGQTAPDYVRTLDVFFPVTLDDCLVNYANLTGKPTMIMSVANDKKTLCRAQTEIELVQDGFEPKNFRYRYISDLDQNVFD